MVAIGRFALVFALLLPGCAHVDSAAFTGTALPAKPAPDFTLTDQLGKPWTLSGQRGKTVAIFFGYTHCLDTCPDTLAKLSKAAQAQGARANEVTIAFVTIDPGRDTPTVLKRYVAQFTGAPIVGLTGTANQIESVERDYHVWSQRIPGAHSQKSHGRYAYDEAHSSVTYLVDSAGLLRVVHDDADSLSAFAADMRTLAR